MCFPSVEKFLTEALVRLCNFEILAFNFILFDI